MAVILCCGCQLHSGEQTLNTASADEEASMQENSEYNTQKNVTADLNFPGVKAGVSEDGISITFSEDGITTDAVTGVSIDGNVVTITEAGDYELSGSSIDARVEVLIDKESDMELVLNGLDITCKDYAPIVVNQAGNVTIDLAEGSVNRLADGEEYSLSGEEDKTDAVIFCRDDLKLKGDGTLYIEANYHHGIVGKDDLTFKGGTYIIRAVEDGVNANDSITIDGGTFYIAAGDDGMHVDEVFTINEADIVVAESYEGLEGHQVIINGGGIDITASDDGINSGSGSTSEASDALNGEAVFQDGENTDLITGKNDAILEEQNGGFFGAQRQGGKGGMLGGMGTDSDSLIQINGGTIRVNANGDGLDSNGVLTINGGTIAVSGATDNGNAALDYGISATISGGSLIATGYSGMIEAFGSESAQCSLVYNTGTIISEGTELVVRDAQNRKLLQETILKNCNSIIVSLSQFEVGESYSLVIGDEVIEVELTDVVTTAGEASGGKMPGGNRPNGGGMWPGGDGWQDGGMQPGGGKMPKEEMQPEDTMMQPDSEGSI